jgi:SNF2 family DNA or RNA helicase
MPRDAHVTLTRDGRMVIKPAANTSLRGLERALRAAGISITLDPVAGTALTDVSALETCRVALRDWTLLPTSAVLAAAETVQSRRAWHSAALAACRIAVSSPETARSWLVNYEPIGLLDAHQVTAVALASHPDVKGLCIFDEQGLGKTVEALFAFDRLREQGLVGRCLIFAPKNMVLEWVNDLRRFFGTKYRAAAVVGNEAEKRVLLDSPADIFVTNFETAIQLEVRLRLLLQGEKERGLLIVDESFFVKNSEARRAQALRRLRTHAGRCLVLCGTPAPNSALDLVEQFNIADDGETFSQVDLSDLEAAHTKIATTVEARGVYIRRLKGAVLPELPLRTFNRVMLPMPRAQQRLYDSVLSGLIEDIRVTGDKEFKRNLASFMARRSALLQICSNPIAIDPTFNGEVPAKLAALDSILPHLIGAKGEKVVLWSFFTASLNALCERYACYNPVRIDGSVSAVSDRREAVRRFQEDDTTMLFVGNPAAAGAGLTLHRARYAIYESMSNQAAHYLQSLDRIHRRGQRRPVEYLILLCDETIETAEYDRLIEKETRAQKLLHDEVAPALSREAFLEDLLSSQRQHTGQGTAQHP